MSSSAGSSEWVDPLLPSEWVDPTSVHDFSGDVPLPAFDGNSCWEDDTMDFPGWLDSDAAALWDGEEWIGDPDIPDCTPLEASKQLADIWIQNYHSGKMRATEICRQAYWASKGGMPGAVTELAKRSGFPSSHYSRHIKRALGLDDDNESLQFLDIPSSDPCDGSRVIYRMPVLPPEDLLNREMADDGDALNACLDKQLRDDLLPPVYTTHPVVLASSRKVQPIVIYIDGVPYTKRGTVLGVWVYFMLS